MNTAKPIEPKPICEERNQLVSYPTTTTTSVRNKTEWFAFIMDYLEIKAIMVWTEAHQFNSADWDSQWPVLLDVMMQNATRQACRHLKTMNLVSPN